MWRGKRYPGNSLATLFLVLLAQAASGQNGEPITALIQGDALDRIRAATLQLGGEITHDLPIISAIGATLPAANLEKLRSQDFVERVIDDVKSPADPEPPPDCLLAASLELQRAGSAVTWRLYNKSADPLSLSSLQADWPEALGALRAIQIGGDTVPAPSLPAPTGPVELPLTNDILAPGAATTLMLAFENAPETPLGELQNGIDLTVRHSDECSVELVPSYADPLGNSYYPGESGALLLHRYGVTGRGVTVAVLDSGLWERPRAVARRSDGTARILARYDAIQGQLVETAIDESGHGTHMTSILARSDRATEGTSTDSAPFRGIAPDVSLVVVKAFDSTGSAELLDLVRAVQWVVDNREKYDIRVVNLSFSMRPRWPYWDDPLNQALMRAWEAGLVLVAAAGNDGPEAMTVGSPGNLPYLITVGAVTDSWTPGDRRDDYIPDFSSRGPTPAGHIKPDILAYGGHITGLIEPGTTLTADLPEYTAANGELVMTGTSQAAAIVSGLAALIIQAKPAIDNNALKCMLTSSAEPAISSDGRFAYSPFSQGHGLASVQRALTIGQSTCRNANLDISADIARTEHYYGPAIFEKDELPTLPDAEALISEKPPQKGHSDARRWGVEAHLQRLDTLPDSSPIDWLSIYQEEQAKIKSLTQNN